MPVDETLAAYLEAYTTAFDAMTGLSTLCFGAAVFLFVRGLGIVVDDDVGPVSHNGLLVFVIICASLSWILVFLAESQIASFYNDMFRRTAAQGCAWVDRMPASSALPGSSWYFETCTRPYLKWFVRIAMATTLLAAVGLVVWLRLHLHQRKGVRPHGTD